MEFNSKAAVLNNLTSIDENNRNKLKEVNNSLVARGSTNIIVCLGTLQSCLAQNFKIELTLGKGVTVTKTFGPEFGPTSNVPLTINVGSFSSDTERDFVLISKIESLSSEAEEAVLIEAKVSCSIEGKVFSKNAVLALKLVSDPAMIGQPCKTIEENLLRVEAAELIKEAESDISKGNFTKAESKIQTYQARVDSMDIDSSIKEKMSKMVKIDLLQNKKQMKSLARDLNDQAFNPESKNQVQMNFKQKKLMMRRV